MEIQIVDQRLKVWGFPQYKTPGAAAFDLHACGFTTAKEFPTLEIWDGNGVYIDPSSTLLISCGFKCWINNQALVGLVSFRSSMSGTGLVMPNSPGIIDSDYQGECLVPVRNVSDRPFILKAGTRIAQMTLVSRFTANFVLVDEFSGSTKRGEGGFGSTGV